MRSTDDAFVGFVDRYLASFRADDVEAPSVLSADMGAGKTLPGGMKVQPKLTLYFGTTAIYRGHSQLEMTGRLVRFVRNSAWRFKNDHIRLDGGAVSIGGEVVLVLGGRDHRVAAVTAGLVARGAASFGDDAVSWEPLDRLLQPAGLPLTLEADLAHARFPEVVPAPRRPRRQASGEVPRVWPVPLLPEEIGGSSVTEPAPIDRVVLLDVHAGAPTSVEPVERSAAIFVASRSVANLEVWGERALIALGDLYDRRPFERVTTGSVDEAVDAIVASTSLEHSR